MLPSVTVKLTAKRTPTRNSPETACYWNDEEQENIGTLGTLGTAESETVAFLTLSTQQPGKAEGKG